MITKSSFIEALFMLPANGPLVLNDKAVIDPENPAAGLAASIKLPPDLKRAVVLVLPATPGGETLTRSPVVVSPSIRNKAEPAQ